MVADFLFFSITVCFPKCVFLEVCFANDDDDADVVWSRTFDRSEAAREIESNR